MFIHDDIRRTLIELTPGYYRVCKAVVAKSGCVVGEHHHLKKDERFILVSGTAHQVVIGDQEWANIKAPYEWFVPRGNYHLFRLSEGAVLLGAGTADFDPNDEIKGHPQ